MIHSSRRVQKKAETPRRAEIRSKMARLFVSYLLGVCLLLSQLPAEIQGQRNQKKNEFIKLCGSELALYWIRLCGNLNWDRMALSPKEPRLRSGPLAGERSRPWPFHVSHWWLPSSCRPIRAAARTAGL